jgi:purine-binding chemotaxis protein CheW
MSSDANWGSSEERGKFAKDMGIDRSAGQQFVTFSLADEEYGVDIMKVQEIIGYQGFTKIPNLPDFIKGVINLRGTVVPVVDLRAKFFLDEKEYNRFTVIIVLTVLGRIMGMIVDAISDVVTFNEDEMEETPDFGGHVRTEFIKGMGKRDEKFVILLDIDRVMNAKDLESIDEAGDAIDDESSDIISAEPGDAIDDESSDIISAEPGDTGDTICAEPGDAIDDESSDIISAEPGDTIDDESVDTISVEPVNTGGTISAEPSDTGDKAFDEVDSEIIDTINVDADNLPSLFASDPIDDEANDGTE